MSGWATIIGSAMMLAGALLLFTMVGVDLVTETISFSRSTYWGPLAVVIMGALMMLVSLGIDRSND